MEPILESVDRFLPLNIEPSAEQIAIQTSRESTILVQANAGAAKTTTLALRIAQVLMAGMKASSVLVLTYTKPACDAMRNALAKIGVPISTVSSLRVWTFDEFAATVLKGVEGKGRVPSRASHEEVAPYVREAIRKLGIVADDGMVERFLAASLKLKGTLARDLAVWSGETISDDFAEDIGVDPTLLKLFKVYEDIRYAKRDGVDRPVFRWQFDATYDLAYLLTDPDPLTYLDELPAWPRHLRLLLVDEMHDLNFSTFTIMRRLLDTNDARFCGVGDFDQVIHEVAGAEQRFMSKDVDLGKRRVRTYPLTATHRFSRSLAAMAGNLADKRYASAAAHSTRVRCEWYGEGTGATCESLLVAAAREWKTANRGDMTGFTVLLRHSWQSVALENALLKAELPYETDGLISYVLQPEVLLIRGLLAMATGEYGQLCSVETRVALVRAVVFFCGIELGHEFNEEETQEERLQSAIRHIAADADSLAPFMTHQVLQRAEPHLAQRMRSAIRIVETSQGDSDWFDRFLDALDVRAWVNDIFVERQRKADALAYFEGLKHAAKISEPKRIFRSPGSIREPVRA